MPSNTVRILSTQLQSEHNSIRLSLHLPLLYGFSTATPQVGTLLDISWLEINQRHIWNSSTLAFIMHPYEREAGSRVVTGLVMLADSEIPDYE